MKDVLDNNVKEVRFSDRLVDTLACLVVEEGEMSAHMERIYKNANQDIGNTKRILELNASHPVVNKMKDLYEANSHDPAISDYAELIFDQALLLEGSKIKDLNRFTKLMGELMAK
jgi:molecular chaperone HtpG